MSTLAEAVTALVEDLSDAHVRALTSVYASADAFSVQAASAALQALPATHRSRARPVNEAWAESPGTSGAAIALSLQIGLISRSAAPADTVDVVVTGPDSPAAPVRLTSEVVRQLIDQAQKRATLVSYAACQLPSVIEALDAAAARGVRVDLILESPEHLEGGGGSHAYAKYRTYEWPVDHRDPLTPSSTPRPSSSTAATFSSPAPT